MQPSAWLQLALTLGTIVVGGVVFYFKNLDVLRKEISGSEGRLRDRIDGVRDEVHRLEISVAEMRGPRTSSRPSTAPAE